MHKTLGKGKNIKACKILKLKFFLKILKFVNIFKFFKKIKKFLKVFFL